MNYITLPQTDLRVSCLGYGCMNIGPGWNHEPASDNDIQRAEAGVMTALDCGINLFDHADIYMHGACEKVFSEVLKRNPGLRDKILIQTKCGIRFADSGNPGIVKRYDFSGEHITRSVDNSLQRLGVDHIDVLLLHRPDALTEPHEIAAVFDELHRSGKVRYFGLSNHPASRARLLSSIVRQPLIINQVELSLRHHALIDETVFANTGASEEVNCTGILDDCLERNRLLQAWAPLAGGRPLNEPGPLSERIRSLSVQKGLPGEALMLSWLLHLPGAIQPIIGTTNPQRIKDCCAADGSRINRDEWYALYESALGRELP